MVEILPLPLKWYCFFNNHIDFVSIKSIPEWCFSSMWPLALSGCYGSPLTCPGNSPLTSALATLLSLALETLIFNSVFTGTSSSVCSFFSVSVHAVSGRSNLCAYLQIPSLYFDNSPNLQKPMQTSLLSCRPIQLQTGYHSWCLKLNSTKLNIEDIPRIWAYIFCIPHETEWQFHAPSLKGYLGEFPLPGTFSTFSSSRKFIFILHVKAYISFSGIFLWPPKQLLLCISLDPWTSPIAEFLDISPLYSKFHGGRDYSVSLTYELSVHSWTNDT